MRKVIDIHTHLFNLKYLPVAGILVRYAHPFVSPRIAFAIEKLLIRHTGSTYAAAMPVGKKMVFDENTLDRSIGSDFLKMDFYRIKKDLVNSVSDFEFSDPQVQEGLLEFQEKALAENFISELEAVHFPADAGLLKQTDENIFRKLRNLFERLIDWICTKVKEMSNYFKWFRFMQNSEENILKYLMNKDGSGVELYIHHLMDVDNYFNEPPEPSRYVSYFTIEEQINNMAMLNQKYSNKIYGFVAFDPSRANCLNLVKDAIENKGFRGIKFYPPLGYRPFNDPKYRNHIDALFTYCQDNDIPIFAHCNMGGFEAYPKKDSGHNSNPMFWYNALKQYPDLRLCLAHAGGGEGWFAEPLPNDEILPEHINDIVLGQDEQQDSWNSSYAKIVYKLCLEFKNVYCDTAYLDELSDPRSYSYMRLRLQKLFRAQPSFSKKIIYGSDWHMLFQEGINQTYMSDYIKLFDEIGFSQENREDFFWNNASNYLKIR
ncbi:amidohydrolase family protein [Flavobacterium beibuense]|uniref:Amidohydrolase family n=1 Tax=Flavobacterium beibuense TaxID=657326 RepID=A0A444WEL6_9FLAO|nr:amidohydrolase family protein [Flavobacterium beibuense]RYJ44255.1 Amidohydrolase family [Flavobacterium beibuense]